MMTEKRISWNHEQNKNWMQKVTKAINSMNSELTEEKKPELVGLGKKGGHKARQLRGLR